MSAPKPVLLNASPNVPSGLAESPLGLSGTLERPFDPDEAEDVPNPVQINDELIGRMWKLMGKQRVLKYLLLLGNACVLLLFPLCHRTSLQGRLAARSATSVTRSYLSLVSYSRILGMAYILAARYPLKQHEATSPPH